jgi:hypothetical protein
MRSAKPRSGERMQPTAQAVGGGQEMDPAPKGRKKTTTQVLAPSLPPEILMHTGSRRRSLSLIFGVTNP